MAGKTKDYKCVGDDRDMLLVKNEDTSVVFTILDNGEYSSTSICVGVEDAKKLRKQLKKFIGEHE